MIDRTYHKRKEAVARLKLVHSFQAMDATSRHTSKTVEQIDVEARRYFKQTMNMPGLSETTKPQI